MNTGVEILLKRMADCPEDFYYNPDKGESRWARLVDHALADNLLDEEEQLALAKGMREVRRQKFTGMVMKQLAGVEDEASDEGKSYSVPKTNTYPTGLPQHILDAQKYQTELMRQHLDEHRKALENIDDKEKSKMLEMLKSYVAYNKKKATQR